MTSWMQAGVPLTRMRTSRVTLAVQHLPLPLAAPLLRLLLLLSTAVGAGNESKRSEQGLVWIDALWGSKKRRQPTTALVLGYGKTPHAPREEDEKEEVVEEEEARREGERGDKRIMQE